MDSSEKVTKDINDASCAEDDNVNSKDYKQIVDFKYSFEEVLTDFKFNGTKKAKDLFLKWNLSPGLQVKRFYVKPRIRKVRTSTSTNSDSYVIDRDEIGLAIEEMIYHFLSDPIVLKSFKMSGVVPDKTSHKKKNEIETNSMDNDIIAPNALGTMQDRFQNIKLSKLSTSATSMNFFDPLVMNDIITDTGYIRGCIDEMIDDNFTINDKLREMLINSESDNCDVFSFEQKQEFLYHLLRLICVGGSLCQPETKFDEWKIAVKDMYKDLITVHKNLKGDIEVSSKVFHVDSEDSNSYLFPRKSPHNRCYIIVDGTTNIVTMIFKPFESFWV